MPAYIVFIRDNPIRDADAMKEYSRVNRSAPPPPGMTALAAYGAITKLEGPAPDGAVILQFPTIAEAQAWYDSPTYQEAIPHRMRGADYRVFIIEGL
jgi:uncharacterized protein (DUF1330 family)